MPVYSIDGITPVVDPSAFVHPTAVLIGDVIIGPGCYIGPLASLRGDFGRLVVEEGANLQDTCVMHGFPNTDTVVARHGHIGHGSILHGCSIGEDVLVGMNAVIMDNADVGESSIIGANAFVKADMKIEPRSLVVGSPARVLREVTDDELEWKRDGTRIYQELTRRCMRSLHETKPLPEMEPGRKRMQVEDVIPLYEAKRRGQE